jgi:hypothetical protein
LSIAELLGLGRKHNTFKRYRSSLETMDSSESLAGVSAIDGRDLDKVSPIMIEPNCFFNIIKGFGEVASGASP